MKRRVFSIILALFLLLSMLPQTAWAEGETDTASTETTVSESTDETVVATETDIQASGSCDRGLTWSLDNNGTLTISGNGPMSDYKSNTIPWNDYDLSILTLIIEDGVTRISEEAFLGCENLTRVLLPESVKSIDDLAFSGCKSLTEINLPNSVKSIGIGAFYFCETLVGLSLPNQLTNIESETFAYCKSLTNISIPESVTEIGKEAFYNCTSLNEISLPDSIKNIGSYAFYNCNSLISIALPSSLTSISSSTFTSCSNLTSVEIPSGVAEIGSSAFSHCKSLTSITIPDGVTAISNEAFAHCNSLTNVTLSNTVTRIGWQAFYECHLSSITIPESVKYIDTNAFLKSWISSVTFLGAPPSIGVKIITNKNVYIRYPADNPLWTSEMLRHFEENFIYNGSITWLPRNTANVYEGNIKISSFNSLTDAIKAYDAKYQYIKLEDDMTVDITLTQDLYIDLNGYDLSGVITLNGYKIFGMDSTTDSYRCDSIGYFNCVDEMGETVVPELHWRSDVTGSVKRYMCVESNGEYSFHRFYLGITHTSIKPGADSVGYKAVFAGDEMVRGFIDTYGYSIRLGTNTPITAEKPGDKMQSGKAVTLRIDGYDVENYGEAKLTARVFMTVDGQTIYSTSYTSSLRDMIERVNEQADSLTAPQLAALKEMLERYTVMQTWKVENLL